MRITFRATRAAFAADEDALICAFSGLDSSGVEHTLILQRSAERGPLSEDGGVYIEFDDQINSGYGCVAQCRLTRERLFLDLRERLGALDAVEGFDVALASGDESYQEIRIGLPRIFRGMRGALAIA